jgi:hypothetical protein
MELEYVKRGNVIENLQIENEELMKEILARDKIIREKDKIIQDRDKEIIELKIFVAYRGGQIKAYKEILAASVNVVNIGTVNYQCQISEDEEKDRTNIKKLGF